MGFLVRADVEEWVSCRDLVLDVVTGRVVHASEREVGLL